MPDVRCYPLAKQGALFAVKRVLREHGPLTTSGVRDKLVEEGYQWPCRQWGHDKPTVTSAKVETALRNITVNYDGDTRTWSVPPPTHPLSETERRGIRNIVDGMGPRSRDLA